MLEKVDAISRLVGTREIESGKARVSVSGQTFPTSVEDLWDAVTTAERIKQWFLPIAGELKVGERYQLEGHAGGEITDCEAPQRFAATWEYGDDVSWIELRITKEAEWARLEFEHVAHVDDERWAEFGPGATGVGWDLCLLGLYDHVSGRPTLEPAEAAAWLGSADGKEFVTLSSERWRDASIADGTPAAEAEAAAARTTAAYTGAPE